MDNVPLCIDLDGTLVRTNTLLETALITLKKNPLFLFALITNYRKGKAYVKDIIGRQFDIRTAPLPYNEEFLAWIQQQHAAGRRLILTTASDTHIATQIANQLGIFEDVIASNPKASVTAAGKAQVLCGIFGTNKFSYAGNSHSDLAVWNCSKNAILVDAPEGITSKIQKDITIEKVFTTTHSSSWRIVARTMRIHQWVKNLLLFVPAVAAHEIVQRSVAIHVILGFISFSLLASAVYIFNDITDIPSDRIHPTKKYRPIASGYMNVKRALWVGIICASISIIISSVFLPLSFLGILAVYLVINICYSLFAKKIAYLDIIILAGLYVLRIFAGSFATGIGTSKWLFVWTMFFFLSLAIVKRIIELLRLNDTDKKAHGRGYHKKDLVVLEYSGVAAASASIIILGLYIRSSSIFILYSKPSLLWIVVVVGLCMH